ncbi:MAG: bifunctional riboflavin kinase/FAD synthetase [Caldilineae bacterium]|nr:MAG: bifunctional riboflavin kinase/FAD synthetase [Caldilineae bacterium]
MKVIRHLAPQNPLTHTPTVLTIGSYDGIHRGHRQIIHRLKEAARRRDAAAALITFYPRPKAVLSPNHPVRDYLTTVDEKLFLLEKLGLDVVAVLPFSRQFAQTPARQFIEQVVNVLHPLELWVGPDFRLGKDRQGDIPYLTELGREFGFSVQAIDLLRAGEEAISSTRIRAALAAGRIREVTRLLGDYPFLMGRVVEGARRGRRLGFPTANVAIPAEKLLPIAGVYAVWLHLGEETFPGVANLGVRPTFGALEPMLEVHIFDFQRDIYGQTVRVELVDFLRPERKFESLQALQSQIARDAQRARDILHREAVMSTKNS